MFDRRHGPNETLRSLVDFRVCCTSFSATSSIPGTRLGATTSIRTLDYGLYVDLLERKYEMKAEFGPSRARSYDLGPLDTRRYVRGVVLKLEQFAVGEP
jgi:hypothetical protein